MKLAYFTDRDLRQENAEAVHPLEVVRSLAAQGHEVSLIAPVEVAVPAGVRLLLYGNGNPSGDRRGRLWSQLVVGPVKAARRMRSGNHDGMYVRLSIPLLLTTWLLRMACGERPLIFEINGILRSELGIRRRVLYAPIVPIEGFLLRQADALVAASDEIRLDLVGRHHPRHVITVPNGVNPERFHPIPRDVARDALGLEKTTPIIGFVGNFAYWHGVEVLLRALPAIQARHRQARIMLIGGGPRRRAIEAEIDRLGVASAVDMIGTVPHERIPSYINACSCCVSPAIPMRVADPGRNSLKVYEYLACGVPVVLSDLPGVARLVKSRRLGAVVEPNNPAALADAVSEVLCYDKATLDRIREEARAAVIEDYSWDANAAQVVKLFRETRLPSGSQPDDRTTPV
jgi:glycosyltransferase involved in cell wall biosynthesis